MTNQHTGQSNLFAGPSYDREKLNDIVRSQYRQYRRPLNAVKIGIYIVLSSSGMGFLIDETSPSPRTESSNVTELSPRCDVT